VSVYDGRWEASDAYVLDRHDAVDAWVKNDHLGFEVLYVYRGVVRKYRPDFLVRLANGEHVIIETKGEEAEEDAAKRRFLEEWVRAVNADGRFGRWRAEITRGPGEVRDVLVG
jgi:type III restriction enzyme